MKIALLGCVLACLAAPANAVVAVQKTAIAADMTDLPIARSPAPANVQPSNVQPSNVQPSNLQPSPPLGKEPLAIAIPSLLIGLLLFRLRKKRSPRPVTA